MISTICIKRGQANFLYVSNGSFISPLPCGQWIVLLKTHFNLIFSLHFIRLIFVCFYSFHGETSMLIQKEDQIILLMRLLFKIQINFFFSLSRWLSHGIFPFSIFHGNLTTTCMKRGENNIPPWNTCPFSSLSLYMLCLCAYFDSSNSMASPFLYIYISDWEKLISPL